MIGSTLLSRAQGPTYVFTVEVARNAFASQGVLGTPAGQDRGLRHSFLSG
jgi:hypothetical protein